MLVKDCVWFWEEAEMRIAQMLDTLRIGGAQKMQIFLTQSLQPLGIEVTVINLRNSANEAVVAELEGAGARVITFPFQRLFSPVSFLKLVRFLRKEKFDLLHVYLTYSNIIGSLAGWLSGAPVIASLRSANFNKENVPVIRIFLENIALKYFARRVTANGYSVAEFGKQRLGKTPIDVIVNSVDLIEPLPVLERNRLRQEITGSAERQIILSAGRLVIQKGFLDLVEALHLIVSKYPDACNDPICEPKRIRFLRD